MHRRNFARNVEPRAVKRVLRPAVAGLEVLDQPAGFLLCKGQWLLAHISVGLERSGHLIRTVEQSFCHPFNPCSEQKIRRAAGFGETLSILPPFFTVYRSAGHFLGKCFLHHIYRLVKVIN